MTQVPSEKMIQNQIGHCWCGHPALHGHPYIKSLIGSKLHEFQKTKLSK